MNGIISWRLGKTNIRKGSLYFRIYLELVDGEIVQQRGGFGNEKEAELERERIIAELYYGNYAVWGKTRAKEFYRYWINDVKKMTLAHSSYYAYKRCIENHIAPALGSIHMEKLSREQIRCLYRQTYDKSPSVAKLVRGVLSASLKFAYRNGYTSKDLVVGEKWNKYLRSKSGKNAKQALDIENIKMIMRAANGSKVYLSLLFADLMGLRRGEIIGLKFSDINHEKRSIYIRRQLGIDSNKKKVELSGGTYTKQEIKVKTINSVRELALPDLVYEEILAERVRYEKRRNRRKREFKDLDFIVASTYGRSRSGQCLAKWLTDLINNHELPYTTWRNLRYTYTSMLVKAGYSLESISHALGHSSVNFTADTYVDVKQCMAGVVIKTNKWLIKD